MTNATIHFKNVGSAERTSIWINGNAFPNAIEFMLELFLRGRFKGKHPSDPAWLPVRLLQIHSDLNAYIGEGFDSDATYTVVVSRTGYAVFREGVRKSVLRGDWNWTNKV
jgi:hypothetical protein